MAITIDWGNSIIQVPKSYMTVIQASPFEVLQLDVNQFRLDLRGLEASEDGMPFLVTHRHNTEQTLSGISYARSVEIINGYTVEFEDGQYGVTLYGANNNLLDVKVANQVSLLANNSAGLINSEAINDQSYTNNRVYINDDTGTTGTVFPKGTPTDPVNNLADAEVIATARKLDSYSLTTHMGALVLTGSDNINFSHWYGVTAGTSRLSLGGASAENSSFDRILLIGDVGSGPIYVTNGSLSNVSGFSGSAKEVAINGILTIDSAAAEQIVFFDCYSVIAGTGRPTLDLNGVGVDIIIRGYTGGLTLTNMSQNINVSFDGKAATLELDATCTNGIINIGGMTQIIDNSVGTTVVTDRSVSDLTEAVKIVELWQLQGLDVGNPMTVTQTKRTVDTIDLDLTGDGITTTTVTRN
jgi:hypothetical protein